MAFSERSDFGLVPELSQESFPGRRRGVAVGGLGVGRLTLGAPRGPAGEHPGAQLADSQ